MEQLAAFLFFHQCPHSEITHDSSFVFDKVLCHACFLKASLKYSSIHRMSFKEICADLTFGCTLSLGSAATTYQFISPLCLLALVSASNIWTSYSNYTYETCPTFNYKLMFSYCRMLLFLLLKPKTSEINLGTMHDCYKSYFVLNLITYSDCQMSEKTAQM